MAIKKQRKPTIFHSDQGSEYSSMEFRDLLTKDLIIQSNSEKASPWQNGFQESFYGKFKEEMGLHRFNSCSNYMEVYNLIAQRIQYYNTKRIHTSIKNIPVKFYQEYILEAKKEEKKVS